MSRETLQTVRQAYDAYEQAGAGALFSYFDPDIEWDMTKTGAAGRVHRGHENVRAFFESLSKTWDEWSFHYDTYIDADDEVLAIGMFRARARADRTAVEAPLVHIWTVRGGKAMRLRAYLDHSEALEAAGLAAISGENLEVVRRAFDAFERRDIAAVLDCFDPDVRVREDASLPDAREYRGHDGVLQWLRGMDRNWEDFRVRPERFLDRENDVAALMRVHGRGRTSRVPVGGEFGSVFTVGDGRIEEWQIYAGWSETLNAWGLHPEDLASTE